MINTSFTEWKLQEDLSYDFVTRYRSTVLLYVRWVVTDAAIIFAIQITILIIFGIQRSPGTLRNTGTMLKPTEHILKPCRTSSLSKGGGSASLWTTEAWFLICYLRDTHLHTFSMLRLAVLANHMCKFARLLGQEMVFNNIWAASLTIIMLNYVYDISGDNSRQHQEAPGRHCNNKRDRKSDGTVDRHLHSPGNNGCVRQACNNATQEEVHSTHCVSRLCQEPW